MRSRKWWSLPLWRSLGDTSYASARDAAVRIGGCAVEVIGPSSAVFGVRDVGGEEFRRRTRVDRGAVGALELDVEGSAAVDEGSAGAREVDASELHRAESHEVLTCPDVSSRQLGQQEPGVEAGVVGYQYSSVEEVDQFGCDVGEGGGSQDLRG